MVLIYPDLTMSLIASNCTLNSCKFLSGHFDLFLNGSHEASLTFKLSLERHVLSLLGLQLLLHLMMA